MSVAEKALVKLREQGWLEIASSESLVYVEGRTGLRALHSADATRLWQNTRCTPVGATMSIIGNELFTACERGRLSVLDANSGRVLQSAPVPMEGVNAVAAAGKQWLAVQGWNDGAAISSSLIILKRNTLKPITGAMPDATFLGVIGNRAYIDDWCCNGRADEYRPATVYSISLLDGSKTEPADLRPDPDRHPPNLQPIGQGEHNYMRGHYLYVPVGDTLYTYDVLHLSLPPVRQSLH